MNPVFGSHRRADEFELLLSRSSVSGREWVDPTAERYGDLLQLVVALREAPAPEPRADFSADLRARLMVAAESALAPDTDAQSVARRAPAVRRSPRERRVVAAVGGFAIISATASMAVAAQSALPGDTLYPLKRAIENAQAGVQRDADSRGTTLLDNASGRLAEVDALSRSGADGRAIASTLQDFVQQATEASDLLLGDFATTGRASSVAQLRSFTADSMGALTSLQDVVPDDARASLIEASQVITAIDVQAQSVCPTCTDLPIMEAPVFSQKSIDSLIDDALRPIADPAASTGTTSRNQQDRPRKGTGKDGGTSTGSGEGTDTGQSTPSSQPKPSAQTDLPAEPTLPAAPTAPAGTDSGGAKDGGKVGTGPLDDVKVSGSDDPIGDLLNGVDDTDGVVKDPGGLG